MNILITCAGGPAAISTGLCYEASQGDDFAGACAYYGAATAVVVTCQQLGFDDETCAAAGAQGLDAVNAYCMYLSGGFDCATAGINECDVLTNPETFGTYEVEIRGELGAYCDDDELLDIYSEWQITVEYEDDITILNGQECTPNGDINEDGITNVIDIVQMVNSILDDSIELTDYQICLLDLNTDGLVNVIDIVSLVNLILES